MRVFLMGAKPSMDLNSIRALNERFDHTGKNTGNQVIGYGLIKALSADHISWDHRLTPQDVSEQFDVIVVAAANFLHPSFDFTGMANFIEATPLPCVIVGLGAQSNDYSTDIVLHPGTERLIKIISERSKFIGVRGKFTARVLSARGINNFQIIGCPSYYMSGQRELRIEKPELPARPKVAINLSRDVIRHSFNPDLATAAIHKCIALAIDADADFIAQTEHEEMQIAMHGCVQRRGDVGSLMSVWGGLGIGRELERWICSHMRVYWSVADWLDEMKSYDFVFGQRFHGNMVAIQAGTPAVVICHDSRTTEMCEFLALPFIRLEDADEISIDRLYERFDADALAARYRVLFARYVDFLRSNDLVTALSA